MSFLTVPAKVPGLTLDGFDKLLLGRMAIPKTSSGQDRLPDHQQPDVAWEPGEEVSSKEYQDALIPRCSNRQRPQVSIPNANDDG